MVSVEEVLVAFVSVFAGGAVVVGVEAGFVVSGCVDTLVAFDPDVVGVVVMGVGSFTLGEVMVVIAGVAVMILFVSEEFVVLLLLLKFC